MQFEHKTIIIDNKELSSDAVEKIITISDFFKKSPAFLKEKRGHSNHVCN